MKKRKYVRNDFRLTPDTPRLNIPRLVDAVMSEDLELKLYNFKFLMFEASGRTEETMIRETKTKPDGTLLINDMYSKDCNEHIKVVEKTKEELDYETKYK